MKSKRHVVQRLDNGYFLRLDANWTPHLQEARVFYGSGAANNAGAASAGRFDTPPKFKVIPVWLSVAAE